jgi:von Willebrand factor
MIGGWRPWQRWMAARRLERHARREGGEPPPDLLRRLREDIPSRPVLMRHPMAERERRGASRRWLAAASLAAAVTASVVGLRVWQQQSRDVSPGWAGAGKQANEEASPPAAFSRTPPSDAPASPSVAPAPPTASQPPGAFPALPRKAAPAGPPAAAASPPRQLAGLAGRATGGGPPVGSADAARPGTAAGGAVGGEPGPPTAAEHAAGARGAADEIAARSEAAAADEAAQSAEGKRSKLEKIRGEGASQRPQRPVATPAAPSGTSANEAAPAERAEGAAPAAVAAPQFAPPPPAAAAAARPAVGAEAKSSTSREAQMPAAPAAPLRSSFGADTGTDSYRRVRRGLLAEGRLPRAASVRADELANAFDLAGEVPAVGRPELSVEGAPLPAAGATYLVRFEARGLLGRSSPDAVEVDFDPTVVARFRRVGATAHRGGAAALYEIELRPTFAAAPAAQEVTAGSRPDAAGTAMAPEPVAAPRPSAAPRMKAASPQPAGEPRGAPASRPGYGTQDRVIATLRVVSRDQGSIQGGALLAARVVRLHQLHPSWDAASPALRVQGLAVQLAQALAAKDPLPRLQEVRARVQALAAELPEDPKAAELLQLADRAADLAGATPRPP